ncbi:LysR family transcriptional regulator [Dickeya sp. ws52]|uniref:LysR family transcriptional regulator n=1 Tax=Dickeya sp. ws52 TaxID=2576377 RepID=UPI00117C7E8A|nr:LysR family transcriptional regulator [Dickeya sp. ws52]TYL41422.1 LysR family transcriptional regulator [Dickeya sp. ws52]
MSRLESFADIRTFVAAAESASFTAAAEGLNVSKSAVGKSIARLEERLGVKLFHRTTRRISLTADGEAYYVTCSSALAEIVAIEETLSSRAETPSGRLRIDLPAAYGRKVILPLLLRMTQEYPRLNLTTTFSDYLIDPIEDGVDLLIRFGEIKDTSDLVARSLGKQKLKICASPQYLHRAGLPVTTQDLMEHKCVVGYRRGQPLSWSVLTEENEVIRFAPPPTHQMGDGEAIIAAALSHCGLCQLPSSLVDEYLERGELVHVLQETTTFVDVHLVWPKTRHVLPKVRCVVDELIALQEEGLLK